MAKTRATAALVREVVEVDPTFTDDALLPFIEVANELVTELCLDSDYTSSRLKKIETWLSAHFYRIRDVTPSAEKAGSVGINYFGKVELGLDLTFYGQTVKRLDTAGNLAALDEKMKNGGKKTVETTWLGDASYRRGSVFN